MFLHSEQIDHQGHLIVFLCHFIQCSPKLAFKLVVDTPIIMILDTKYFN